MKPELERFSLRPLFREHYRGLRSPRSGRISSWTWIAIAAVPVTSGALAAALGFVFSDAVVAPLLTVLGMLAAALLSGFVMLTNLRVKISESQQWSQRTRTQRLVAQSAVTCLYVMLMCLILSASLVATVGVFGQLSLAPTPVALVFSAVLVAMAAHIGVTFLTVVRRLYYVYFDLFQVDFGPDLTSVPRPPKDGQRSA